MEGFIKLVQQTNCTDERGLCVCPQWRCENEACWLFHEGRDCIPFTLSLECTLGDKCEQKHSIASQQYHKTQRPCLYSVDDTALLRHCNDQIAEELNNKRNDIESLFDTPKLQAFTKPLTMFSIMRSKEQILCVSRFILECGHRWRQKIQLLELWFRKNNLNTWLSSHTHVEEGGTTENTKGEYIHVPSANLIPVCWDAPDKRCPFKLNISTRPKLESLKEMLTFNDDYKQSFSRLPEAGMLIVVQNCIICMDAEKNTKFDPCNHVACCSKCVEQLKECPICRTKINKIEDIFIV